MLAVLVWLWRKGNISSPLVKEQISAAPMQTRVELPQKASGRSSSFHACSYRLLILFSL